MWDAATVVCSCGVQLSCPRTVNFSAVLKQQRPGHVAKSWHSRPQWAHRHTLMAAVWGTFQGMHATRTHEGFATVPGLDWQQGCMAQGHRGTQVLLPLNLRASNRLSCPTSFSSC